MSKKEIEIIYGQFLDKADYLICTKPNEGIYNLRQLIKFIDEKAIISAYIKKNNTKTFSVADDINNGTIFETYALLTEESDRIAYTYQLLKYASQNCKDYFYYLCLNYSNMHGQREQIELFNQNIVVRLCNSIDIYLEKLLRDKERYYAIIDFVKKIILNLI